uniref:Uncharacterized protein n=1 Tax=Takifugu rubripes TaxID=31033 RepID=A0A3B5KET6_TAKRU
IINHFNHVAVKKAKQRLETKTEPNHRGEESPALNQISRVARKTERGTQTLAPPRGNRRQRAPPRGNQRQRAPPRGNQRQRAPPRGNQRQRAPPRGNQRQRAPPRGNQRQRAPPRGNQRQRAPPRGNLSRQTRNKVGEEEEDRQPWLRDQENMSNKRQKARPAGGRVQPRVRRGLQTPA